MTRLSALTLVGLLSVVALTPVTVATPASRCTLALGNAGYCASLELEDALVSCTYDATTYACAFTGTWHLRARSIFPGEAKTGLTWNELIVCPGAGVCHQPEVDIHLQCAWTVEGGCDVFLPFVMAEAGTLRDPCLYATGFVDDLASAGPIATDPGATNLRYTRQFNEIDTCP